MRRACLFVLTTLALTAGSGCSIMPMGGGATADVPETGIGQQAGAMIGSELGGRYNPLGGAIGAQVGSQAERALTKPAQAENAATK